MLQTVKNAELNRNAFWKTIKKSLNSSSGGIKAIRISKSVVVPDDDEILQDFKDHFEKVSTLSINPDFDEDHFEYISERVRGFNTEHDDGKFLDECCTINEVQNAVSKLHLKRLVYMMVLAQSTSSMAVMCYSRYSLWSTIAF